MGKSSFTSTRARIKLRRILTEVDAGIRPAMQDSVNKLQKEIMQNVPVNTGNLKSLITSHVAKNGLRGEVGLRGKKAREKGFYARFIEYGTKGHKVDASKKVLSSGSNTFGTSANIPAQPARPFLQPAWDNEKHGIIARINKVIEGSIKKAQSL